MKLLAVPYASRVESRIEPMSEAVNGGKNENKSESKRGALQKFLPGGEAADQTSQSSQSGISALGLRGVVL